LRVEEYVSPNNGLGISKGGQPEGILGMKGWQRGLQAAVCLKSRRNEEGNLGTRSYKGPSVQEGHGYNCPILYEGRGRATKSQNVREIIEGRMLQKPTSFLPRKEVLIKGFRSSVRKKKDLPHANGLIKKGGDSSQQQDEKEKTGRKRTESVSIRK